MQCPWKTLLAICNVQACRHNSLGAGETGRGVEGKAMGCQVAVTAGRSRKPIIGGRHAK